MKIVFFFIIAYLMFCDSASAVNPKANRIDVDETNLTTNFSGSNCTTVQECMETIDELTLGGGGSSKWTDSGTVTYLTGTTDELVLGGSAALSSAKFSIDGDADQIQAIIQGHSTQTSSLLVLENSGGTDQLTVSNSGDVVSATLDTGQGANELYDMDQNVLTTSAPTFAGVTFTGDAELGNTPQSIDGGTQGLAFDPDNDGTNEATIDTTGMISADGGFTAGASTDPGIVFDVVTSSDTDFWLAVDEDAGGDDDDTLEIGTGTTELTNTRLTLDGSGNITTYNQSDLRFSDSDSSNYGAIQAPATIGANYTLTLPDTDGDADQYLKTNGSGVLSWATVSGGTISGTDTHVMFFDGTDTPAGDAGFTYNKTTDSATLVGDLTLNGHDLVMGTTSAGVTLTDDGDGALTIAAKGDGSQENLTINLDDASNTATLSTSTGLNNIVLGSDASAIGLEIGNDQWLTFGITGDNAQIAWETTNTRDDLQIGVRVGSDSISGHVSIMERVDMGNSNRQPPNASNDPALLLWSADATSATDYIRIRHDQTNGEIDLGTGDLNILDPVSVTGTLTASGKVTANASLDVKNGATSSGVLAIFEDSSDGTEKATFQVPALASDTAYTLPENDGSSGQVLHTDGNGVLSWDSDDGAGGGAPTDADYLVGTANGSLSAEIVVGTSPGGELGGTWGSPTIDDTGITLTSLTVGSLLGVDSIDATGAVDMDYGSADITDHTFITDGTGDAEIVLPNDSIGAAEVLDTGDFTMNTLTVATEAYDATGWNGDNTVPTKDAVRDKIETISAGSDTNAVKEYWWPASATLPLEAADSVPPPAKDAGTNVDQLAVLFNDSTDECRTVSFKVPSDVDTSGTVTFRVHWYSSSATTNDVYWDFRHNSGVADGADPDQALTTEADAGDTVAGTAGQISVATWTETISNLSWAANDQVDAVFCRDGDNGSDNFSGDAYATGFGVEIPRA